jgi:quercetin dioxygenase-like cupin family protein
MKISDIAFGTTDWSTIAPTEHKGETGTSFWRTRNFGDIRVRIIEYTPGYLTGYWCTKGHVFFCLEGELEVELKDGRKFMLTPGKSFQVADDAEAHRNYTRVGAKFFVVD